MYTCTGSFTLIVIERCTPGAVQDLELYRISTLRSPRPESAGDVLAAVAARLGAFVTSALGWWVHTCVRRTHGDAYRA